MEAPQIDMEQIIMGIAYGPDDDREKIDYFFNFALKHPDEMKILIKGGVLGLGNEAWHNVAKHCITGAIGADILAEFLHANRVQVIKGYLLHDWYKRNEVELMNTLGGQKGYEQASGEDEQRLREYGVPEDIIKIAHSNIVDNVDPEYLNSRTLEEKIVHYIDMINGESGFVDYEERMRVVEQKKRNIEFSESFRSKYDGKTLIELNREIKNEEQKEFEQMLSIETGTLIDFLKKKFEERVTSKL